MLKKASVILLAVVASIIKVILILPVLGYAIYGFGSYIGTVAADTDQYLIAEDRSYVIFEGKKYVPAGEMSRLYTNTEEVLAENVQWENADFIDNFLVYGYMIYAVEGYPDHDVIYVWTAESSESATGYYILESETSNYVSETE